MTMLKMMVINDFACISCFTVFYRRLWLHQNMVANRSTNFWLCSAKKSVSGVGNVSEADWMLKVSNCINEKANSSNTIDWGEIHGNGN